MHLAIIGDSIVHGYDDKEFGGWVSQLKIFSVAQGKDDLIFNLGIPGNSSRDMLKRADGEIKARQPFLNKVIYSTGSNDISQAIPVPEYKANLTKLGEIAEGHGNRVFFLGLFLRMANGKPVDTSAYDQAIQQVCEENNYTYIPTSDLIKEENIEKDMTDDVHPNSTGHAKLSARVAECMLQADKEKND